MSQERVKCQRRARQDGRSFGKMKPPVLCFSSPEKGHNHHYPNELPLEVVM